MNPVSVKFDDPLCKKIKPQQQQQKGRVTQQYGPKEAPDTSGQ